ncbi:MAG: hypothetical protein K2G23_07645 [Muribaculaceae bacterium]|nr:hypothetical protein [Muribaculaceae bacterium]
MNKTTDDMQSVPLVFYSDWMEIINELPDDQQLKVYKALTSYAFNGEMPDDPVIRAITALMFKFIDKDREKYQRAKEQRRNAAKKRWNREKEEESSDAEECGRIAPDADDIHKHNNINIKHKHENINNNRQQSCNSACAHEEPPKPEIFTFWLGEELTKRIKNNSKTVTCHEDNKRDRFSARRGTEPRTQGRKNFKGTF